MVTTTIISSLGSRMPLQGRKIHPQISQPKMVVNLLLELLHEPLHQLQVELQWRLNLPVLRDVCSYYTGVSCSRTTKNGGAAPASKQEEQRVVVKVL